MIISVSYKLVNGSDEKKRNCLKWDNVWCAAKILFHCGNLFNSAYIYLLTGVGSALCLLLGKKISICGISKWMAIDTISNGRWKTLYSSRTILWSIDYEIYWVHKLFSWKGMCHVRIGASRTPIIWLRGRVRCTVNIPGSKPDTQRSQVLGAIVLEFWTLIKSILKVEFWHEFTVVANRQTRQKSGQEGGLRLKFVD